MDINQINNVVFEYIVKMIKDDDDIDIYVIEEDTYTYTILETMLNNWDESGCFDIITEHFGNQSVFMPPLKTFVDMLSFITERRKEFDLETPITTFEGINIHHTCCNVLRYYSYHYIDSLGYENFKLKLKEHINN